MNENKKNMTSTFAWGMNCHKLWLIIITIKSATKNTYPWKHVQNANWSMWYVSLVPQCVSWRPTNSIIDFALAANSGKKYLLFHAPISIFYIYYNMWTKAMYVRLWFAYFVFQILDSARWWRKKGFTLIRINVSHELIQAHIHTHARHAQNVVLRKQFINVKHLCTHVTSAIDLWE